jgi:hypothetical protein
MGEYVVAATKPMPETAIHTERGRLWQAPCGDTWRHWSGFGPCVAAKELLIIRVKDAEVKVKDKENRQRRALIRRRHQQI